jgi:hypothetical protein
MHTASTLPQLGARRTTGLGGAGLDLAGPETRCRCTASPHTPPALLIGGGQDLAAAATDVLVYWSLLPARKLRLALDSQNKRIIPIENSRNDWMVCAWRYFFLSVLIGIDRLTGTIAPRVGSLAALCARVMTSVRT